MPLPSRPFPLLEILRLFHRLNQSSRCIQAQKERLAFRRHSTPLCHLTPLYCLSRLCQRLCRLCQRLCRLCQRLCRLCRRLCRLCLYLSRLCQRLCRLCLYLSRLCQRLSRLCQRLCRLCRMFRCCPAQTRSCRAHRPMSYPHHLHRKIVQAALTRTRQYKLKP